MRKIVFASAVAGAALALAACAEKAEEEDQGVSPEPSPTSTVEPLSEADKQAVDAHGADVSKLRLEMQQHTGTARGTYAFNRMNAAIKAAAGK